MQIQRLLRISWTKLPTTEQIYTMLRTKSELVGHIKSRILRYFQHVVRMPHDSIEASMMTGLVEGVTNCGRPRIPWIDDITTWTGKPGSMCSTRDRQHWSTLTHQHSQQSSVMTLTFIATYTV